MTSYKYVMFGVSPITGGDCPSCNRARGHHGTPCLQIAREVLHGGGKSLGMFRQPLHLREEATSDLWGQAGQVLLEFRRDL